MIACVLMPWFNFSNKKIYPASEIQVVNFVVQNKTLASCQVIKELFLKMVTHLCPFSSAQTVTWNVFANNFLAITGFSKKKAWGKTLEWILRKKGNVVNLDFLPIVCYLIADAHVCFTNKLASKWVCSLQKKCSFYSYFLQE